MRLDRALTDVATGRIKRLVVEMPPRHGKSELCSKYFPAWYLGINPDKNIILTSATDELANDFSAASRDTLLEHGQHFFGVSLKSDSQARHRWEMTAGGGMRAAGVGGSIIGRGANVLIIDDFFKSHEPALSETQREGVLRWFLSTAKTRLTPDGAIVIVCTRWHRQDLVGRMLADEPGQWTQIRFPCIAESGDQLGRQPGQPLWPGRFDLAWCENIRSGLVSSGYEWMWEALYQQNPPDVLDAEFPPQWLEGHDIFYDYEPDPATVLWRIMYLDPSLGKTDKSDYSAYIMLTVTHDMLIYVDASIERRNAATMIDDGLSIYRQFHPHVFGVEGNQFQSVLKDIFVDRANAAQVLVDPTLVHNSQNKIERIRAGLTEHLARRRFRFKRHSPGVSLLIEQLKGFPAIKHDDGPDALEGAVRLAERALTFGPGLVQECEERVYT